MVTTSNSRPRNLPGPEEAFTANALWQRLERMSPAEVRGFIATAREVQTIRRRLDSLKARMDAEEASRSRCLLKEAQALAIRRMRLFERFAVLWFDDGREDR